MRLLKCSIDILKHYNVSNLQAISCYLQRSHLSTHNTRHTNRLIHTNTLFGQGFTQKHSKQFSEPQAVLGWWGPGKRGTVAVNWSTIIQSGTRNKFNLTTQQSLVSITTQPCTHLRKGGDRKTHNHILWW